MTSEKYIQEVLSPDARCCSRQCLRQWKETLGPKLSEAAVRTELQVYGSMREDGRQVHFLTKMKTMAQPTLETSSTGSEKHITGKVGDRPPRPGLN